MGFLAELDPESKPDAIAFVEVHLRAPILMGVQVKIVGGSYRKGAETVTFNNVTIMKLVGNNIIIEIDQVLVGAFTKFMPNFSADVFKTSWAQYKHNNPGAA